MIEFKFKPLAKFPRPATPPAERKESPFKRPGRKEGEAWISASAMPLNRTYDDLRRELAHLNADGPVVIQVAMAAKHVRVDGLLRADAPRPKEPGVVLSFDATIAGRRTPLGPFACDDCVRWEDNLRAIVLTLERLRLADLYGVTKSGEQYQGWSALPPSGGGLVTGAAAAMSPDAAARLILASSAPILSRIEDDAMRARAEAAGPDDVLADRDLFHKLYQVAAFEFHPDRNKDKELPTWLELGRAKTVIEKHQGAQGGQG